MTPFPGSNPVTWGRSGRGGHLDFGKSPEIHYDYRIRAVIPSVQRMNGAKKKKISRCPGQKGQWPLSVCPSYIPECPGVTISSFVALLSPQTAWGLGTVPQDIIAKIASPPPGLEASSFKTGAVVVSSLFPALPSLRVDFLPQVEVSYFESQEAGALGHSVLYVTGVGESFCLAVVAIGPW